MYDIMKLYGWIERILCGFSDYYYTKTQGGLQQPGGRKMRSQRKWAGAVLALILSCTVLAGSAGYFLGQRSTGEPYRVTVSRPLEQGTEPLQEEEEDGWPESLLPGEVIDLNTAPEADLSRLPMIGAKRAQAIVAWREENGPFQTVEDLMAVSGIGEGIFAVVEPYITVGDVD